MSIMLTDSGRSAAVTRTARRPTHALPAEPRVGNISHGLDLVVLLFAVTLLQLPPVLSQYMPASGILVLLPFWFVILKNLFMAPAMSLSYEQTIWRNVRILGGRRAIPLLFAFTFLIVVSLFRGVLNGTQPFGQFVGTALSMITVILFGWALFLTPSSREQRDRVGLFLIAGMCFYVVLNVVLYVSGVKLSREIWAPQGASNLLGTMGVASTRVLFPFASGVNNFAYVAGASFVLATWMAWNLKGLWRLMSIGAVIASLFAIVACDSRGALLFSLLAAFACVLLPQPLRLRSAAWLLVGPVSIAMVLLIVDYLPDELTTGLLARQHSFDSGQAVTTGRTIIWAAAVRELLDVKLIHFLGFGHYGHLVSGVSSEYGSLFGQGAGTSLFSLHNGLLQYIIDTGYLGAALFIATSIAAYRALRELESAGVRESTALLAMIFFFFFAASVESAPAAYTLDGFRMFFLALVFAAFRTTWRETEANASAGGDKLSHDHASLRRGATGPGRYEGQKRHRS